MNDCPIKYNDKDVERKKVLQACLESDNDESNNDCLRQVSFMFGR